MNDRREPVEILARVGCLSEVVLHIEKHVRGAISITAVQEMHERRGAFLRCRSTGQVKGAIKKRMRINTFVVTPTKIMGKGIDIAVDKRRFLPIIGGHGEKRMRVDLLLMAGL